MADNEALIAGIAHWTPALVRKYEEKAFEYMTALVDALREGQTQQGDER